MNGEKLIEEVRKFPVLFDQNEEQYRNVEYKEKIWKIISTNLQAKGGIEECKKRWSSIRDQFRRTLQKRRTSSGQAAGKFTKYKYEDMLGFLIPHVTEKDALSNFYYFQEEKGMEEQMIIEPTIVESIMEESFPEVEESTPELTTKELEIQKPLTEAPGMRHPFLKPTSRKKKNFFRNQENSLVSEFMAYFLTEKNAQMKTSATTKEPITHPVDAFLSGIAPTLKSLSPILLNQAKSKIFAVVQDSEVKQLENDIVCQNQSSPVNLSPTPSPTPSPLPSSTP
uniref:MADF domain-containing protein n=1 Tax=Clastoptera arizonana TaxID=38151 RepID=A0A1B6BXR2_9HEMI